MKVAVALQQIILISKEIEMSDEQLEQLKKNPIIQFPMSPEDKPVVKNILDVFGEDCKVLFSVGRNDK